MSSETSGDAPRLRSVSAAVAAVRIDDGAAPAASLQHADLANLNGHAAGCVGAMLSGMIGDVLGEVSRPNLDQLSGACMRQGIERGPDARLCVHKSTTVDPKIVES